jgi:hypothetical protein
MRWTEIGQFTACEKPRYRLVATVGIDERLKVKGRTKLQHDDPQFASKVC